MSGKEKIVVKVHRYNPLKDEKPHYDTFEVPYVEGMRVNDALIYIYENIDASLAFRYSCLMDACRICYLRVNGKNVLACQVRADKEMTVEPLPGYKIIKDLVVDLKKKTER